MREDKIITVQTNASVYGFWYNSVQQNLNLKICHLSSSSSKATMKKDLFIFFRKNVQWKEFQFYLCSNLENKESII